MIPLEEWIDLEVETPNNDPSLWLLASEGREAVRLDERIGMRTARAWDVYEKRVV